MMYKVLQDLTKKYGPVYTIWLGNQPTIILGTNEAILEAYRNKKNDIAGRPDFFFKTITLSNPNSSDVILEDWGRPWEVLRRVAHSAARNFAVDAKLPQLQISIIDQVVDTILSVEGLNKPFNPKDYIYLMVYSTIASMAAGKSYSIHDEEFLELKRANDVQSELQTELTVIEFLPFMRFVYRSEWKRLTAAIGLRLKWCNEKLDYHLSNYEAVKVRTNFCAALIHAKKEAEEIDSGAAIHLTNDNLKNVVHNLFQAGTETTRSTLMWALLLLANFPTVQKRLRTEIKQVMGEGIPTNDVRIKCHYVQSFIAEVTRFAPIIPAGAPHKAIVDTEIFGHKVPKGTTVAGSIYAALHDTKVWGDPETFRPERFLDSYGEFNARINDAYHPFSVGRRSCLGKQLAMISLFVQITRILQKTSRMTIVLEKGPGNVSLDPDPKQPPTFATADYEIKIVKDSEEE